MKSHSSSCRLRLLGLAALPLLFCFAMALGAAGTFLSAGCHDNSTGGQISDEGAPLLGAITPGTETPAPPVQPDFLGFELVKPGGKVLQLTDRPIPLKVTVRAKFDSAMNVAETQKAISLKDSKGAAIDCAFGGDSKNIEMTPKARLKTGETYKVAMTADAKSEAGVKIAKENTGEFKTMIAGDIDGDGTADIIVGATAEGANDNGAVYIYSGRDLTAPFLKIAEAKESAGFGYAVKLEDIDNDGYADVLASSPAFQIIQTRVGRVYLFKASSLNTNKAGASITTENADKHIDAPAETLDAFGMSIDTGDINGDGYAEIAIGAPYYTSDINDAQNTRFGRVYLCDAGNPDKINFISTLTGSITGGVLGWSAALGDIDGDGKADLLAGAFAADSDKGRAYVYRGSELTKDAVADDAHGIAGENDHNWFGAAVAMADVTGDGKDEVVVGAPFYTDGQNGGLGRVYVYKGDDLKTPLATITGTGNAKTAGRLGAAIARVREAPARDALVIGAPFLDDEHGAIYFFHGESFGNDPSNPILMKATDATGDKGWTHSSTNPGKTGFSVAALDVNADNKAEILFGSPDAEFNGAANGMVDVYGIDGKPLNALKGFAADSRFGFSIAK
ncbi:MAG: FG-GAP-like repeat-containing protein [Pseudomonadota bacterium]